MGLRSANKSLPQGHGRDEIFIRIAQVLFGARGIDSLAVGAAIG